MNLKLKELDKQIEIEAIQKANQAVLEVKQEREIEKKLREKEQNYDDVVAGMANLILEKNENILGSEIVKKAKEKIEIKDTKKAKRQTKEVKINEQEKVKRAGKPRKSA